MLIKQESHILYLSMDGLNDPLGSSQILPYLLFLAEKYAFHFSIISLEKSFEKKEHIYQKIKDYPIHWHPLLYKNQTIFDKIKNFKRLKKYAFKIIKTQEKWRGIHCRSLLPAIIGNEIKKKLGIPFIFDIRGFWTQERLDGKIWRLSNPLHNIMYHFFKNQEKKIFKSANQIVTLTNASITTILKNVKFKQRPSIHVIPCCTDQSLFNPNVLKFNFNKQYLNSFKLLYLGSIGTWYAFEEMVDFFKILKTKLPKAIFIIATQTNKKVIYKIIKKKQLNIEDFYITYANRSQVPSIINSCDLAISLIHPLKSKQASCPTKIGEILSVGKPIVCNTEIGDVEKMINNITPELLIKEFNKKNYTKAINSFLQTSYSKHTISNYAKNIFSLEKGVDAYKKIYDVLRP